MSEIFENDIPPFLNAFFQICLNFTYNKIHPIYPDSIIQETKQMTLLEYLFSFLDTRTELNPTLAAYFQKCIYGLYFFRTKDVDLF